MGTGIPPQNDLESAIVATSRRAITPPSSPAKTAASATAWSKFTISNPGTNSTLANLSTRGFVGTGDNVMIGGLIIGSGDIPIVVVRAIGPTLAAAGIADPLLDPTLELHDGNGAVLGFNDNWKDGQPQAVHRDPARPDQRPRISDRRLPRARELHRGRPRQGRHHRRRPRRSLSLSVTPCSRRPVGDAREHLASELTTEPRKLSGLLEFRITHCLSFPS